MTINDMKAEIAKLHEKATATRSEADKREDSAFTDEERSSFDKDIGDLKSLKTRLKDAEELLQTIPTKPVTPEHRGDADPMPSERAIEKRTILPATPAYRCSNLKAFTGPGAEERAYISGQWLAATIFGNPKSQKWCRDRGIDISESRAMGESTNILGGYLVPEEFSNTVISLRESFGVFRRNVNVIPMGSDSITIGRDTTDLTVRTPAEAATITASDGGWDRITLTAKKWAILTRFSSELDQDAIISIADTLATKMAYAFALKEDQAGFIGDGTLTYHNIIGATIAIDDGTHTASVVDSAGGSLAYADLILTEFETVIGRLPEFASIRPKWYISKVGFYASMARLMDAAGGNTIDILSGGTNMQFLGFPVEFVQVMDTTLTDTASTVKALFGDLSMAATLGDRRGMTLATSADVYFTTDEIGLRATTRNDINVHDLGDNSDAGPLIALATPGS